MAWGFRGTGQCEHIARAVETASSQHDFDISLNLDRVGIIPRVTKVANSSDTITIETGIEAGVRLNISVGVQYLEAWLNGSGAVPINNLMEDAATAEISWAQIWQWIHHKAQLEDGRTITLEMVKLFMREELEKLDGGISRFARASILFLEVATHEPLVDFLTLPGYRELP
jgi:malate synthase